MKGVVFLGDRRVQVVDLPKPTPGPQQVVVQSKASGLCGSDLRPYRQPSAQMTEQQRQVVRGHEPCGVVAELGPCARNVKVGDRVMVHHYSGCGTCKYCLSGWAQLCMYGHKVFGSSSPGGHQEYLAVPDSCCVPLPDAMSFEEGASCACGTGTAYQALRRLQPSGMDTLAVFGLGPVGVSAVLLAKAMGARVIAVDTRPERLALGKRFGADVVVDASKADVVEVIKEQTNGEGAECTIDCTGIDVARVNALKAAKLWGRACSWARVGPSPWSHHP